jgi:hypothetical protein
LTATIREAVENEYKRECEDRKLPLWERLKPIQDWLDARSKPGGLPADKAFFDKLSGEFSSTPRRSSLSSPVKSTDRPYLRG